MLRFLTVGALLPDWISNIFDFALVPAKTFYLDLPVETLLERLHWKTRQERFFDYYESGMDMNLSGGLGPFLR